MDRYQRRRSQRRGRSGRVLLPALFAILLGGTGAFITLVALGQVDVDASTLRSMFGGATAETGSTATASRTDRFDPPKGKEDHKWVPVTLKAIPAYTQIKREHLVLADLKPVPYWVKEENIGDDWIRRPKEAYTRVTAYDIEAGTALTTAMFMPRGTRPGIVGAIPSGKRGLAMSADKIKGVQKLLRRDQFDIFATFAPQQSSINPYSQIGRNIKPIVTGDMINSAGLNRPDIRVIVENAVLIEPISIRRETGSRGSSIVKEITIAASPNDIAALTEAMQLGATLYAVARPGAAPNERLELSDIESGRGVHGIETIIGTNRGVKVISSSR